MSNKEQKPVPPPVPLREVIVPQPLGEIKENSLPTFYNPPPPPPPPPANETSK